MMITIRSNTTIVIPIGSTKRIVPAFSINCNNSYNYCHIKLYKYLHIPLKPLRLRLRVEGGKFGVETEVGRDMIN